LRPSFGLLVGENLLHVGKDIERSRTAHANANWNLQFALNVLFQAHGLYLQVVSKEAALDYDIHGTLAVTANFEVSMIHSPPEMLDRQVF
jgi:hypothetical protein